MDDEPIPLYEGELSGARIIPDRSSEAGETQTVRSRRKNPRKHCERVCVCFSPDDPSGRIEHVECPVLDLSAGGMAIEYDREFDVGVAGYVAYRTVSHQPVRINCTVRRCAAMENGHYLLGLKFDRQLRREELKPAKVIAGREVAPGIRTRKLRACSGSEPRP